MSESYESTIENFKELVQSLLENDRIDNSTADIIVNRIEKIKNQFDDLAEKNKKDINIKNVAYSLLQKTTQDFKTENKEKSNLERRLKENETILHSIITSLDDIVWSTSIDHRQTIFISPKAEQFYDIPISEFYVNIFCWTKLLHPDDINKYSNSIEKIFLNGDLNINYRIVKPNGNIRWINERSKIIKDTNGIAFRIDTSISDITIETIAVEALNESTERLKTIMDSIDAIIYVADIESYDLLFINKYGTDIFGHSEYKKCWEVLQKNLKGPCSFCTNHFLIDINNNSNGVYRWEFQNPITKHWYQCVDRVIKWSDGKLVRLEIAVDITNVKNAEQALIHQKQIIDTIINNAPIGIWMTDSNDKAIFVNKTFDEWTGFSTENSSLTVKQFDQCHFSNTEAKFSDLPYNCIETLTFYDGSEHSLEVIKRRVKDINGNMIGIIGISIDITEKIQTQNKLIESEEKYRKIFENIQDVFYQTDIEGILTEISPSIERYSGYRPDEIIGKPVDMVYYNSESRAVLVTELNDKGEVIDFELVLKHRNGNLIYASVNTHFMKDSKGHVCGIEGSLRNITERKKTELAIKLARDEADKANRAKSEFLANMSHEIRTPMNAILGFAELLSNYVSEPLYKDYVKGIISGGKNLLSLINDILDLSKIEAGRLELQYEAVNLRTILNELQQIFFLKTQDKNLNFELNIDQSIPTGLYLDAVRIRQILLNLIGNAVKFTDKGFIRINTEMEVYDIKNKLYKLKIEVEDSGKGIAQEQQTMIFEAFRQQEGQSNRKYGGTGLGLTITKRLTEMMGGAITVSSKVGFGSLFTVIIDNVKISETPTIDNYEIEKPELNIVFNNQKILIVEDIQSNILVIKGYLKNSNLEIIESNNGKEAIDQLYQGLMPDLILLDIQMPIMDGYEAIKLIRAEPKYKNIPIIALTASAMKENEEFLKNLCNGYLRKPITRNELINELAKHLNFNQKDAVANSKIICKSQSLKELTSELSQDVINSKQFFNVWMKFTNVRKSMFIDEIIKFSEALNEYAESSKFTNLMELALLIKTSAKNFDIDTLINTFNYLDTIIIKELV